MGNDEFGRWLGGCGGRRSVRPPPAARGPPQMTCPFIWLLYLALVIQEAFRSFGLLGVLRIPPLAQVRVEAAPANSVI